MEKRIYGVAVRYEGIVSTHATEDEARKAIHYNWFWHQQHGDVFVVELNVSEIIDWVNDYVQSRV